jgi:hypothetical protein
MRLMALSRSLIFSAFNDPRRTLRTPAVAGPSRARVTWFVSNAGAAKHASAAESAFEYD